MDLRRVELEERVAALCGERIAKVRYFEINYENGQTGWDTYKDRFHTLDYGLDLEMESGRIVGFIWDWVFMSHHIALRDGSIRDDIIDCAVRDVTTDPAWAGLLHQPITEARLYWGMWEILDNPGFTRAEIEAEIRRKKATNPGYLTNRSFVLKDLSDIMETLRAARPKTPVEQVHYPQDLVLTVASGDNIYLCARNYREVPDDMFPARDDIIVIFREDMARHYHVGPHAST